MSEAAKGIKAQETSGSRVPLIAEVLAYVGGALVLAAGWAVMERVWPTWEPTAQMVAVGVTGAALFLAGLPFRTHPEHAFSRMAGVLWFASAGFVMWFLGLLFADVVDLEFGQKVLAFGLAGGAYAAVLLALRRAALQQIPVYVGGVIATFGFVVAFGPTGDDAPTWLTPSLLVFGGLWFGAIGVRLLEPTAAALALGSVTVLAPPIFAVGDVGDVAPVLGLTAAAVLLTVSVLRRRVVLLVCGAIGLFGHLSWTVSEYFGATVGTPLALLVAGAGVLAIALLAARRFGSRQNIPVADSR